MSDEASEKHERNGNGGHHNSGKVFGKPFQKGIVQNPKGNNRYSRDKSLIECLVASGKEVHRGIDGESMTFNEFAAAGMKRIVADFLMNYKTINRSEFHKYDRCLQMWFERLAPVGNLGNSTLLGSEQKTVTVIIHKENPIEVIDVTPALTGLDE